ncbi:hypothetical protein TWF694_001451 [Orbilia ellipsospora]|uniref:Uncharacterized protein n=1 Tax=Orbilia ellipsospora TaxID=2528407 RepID=A0AAV9XRV2_9PEZI
MYSKLLCLITLFVVASAAPRPIGSAADATPRKRSVFVDLDASDQVILPTDPLKPFLPAAEQDGVKFHNVDVVSFLPGVVDESWIVAFGGKKTHYGTNKACFSLTGGNLQLSNDAIKARCLSKDVTDESLAAPLKEEKCPPLAIIGFSGGKVIAAESGSSNSKKEQAEKITACWGGIPKELLPTAIPLPILPRSLGPIDIDMGLGLTPPYVILNFVDIIEVDL